MAGKVSPQIKIQIIGTVKESVVGIKECVSLIDEANEWKSLKDVFNNFQVIGRIVEYVVEAVDTIADKMGGMGQEAKVELIAGVLDELVEFKAPWEWFDGIAFKAIARYVLDKVSRKTNA